MLSNRIALICLIGASRAFMLGYPLHASCKVEWTFGISCDQVKQRLVSQFEAWKTADNCASGGEKCLYTLKTNTDTMVAGTHETPVHHYIDDVSFTLTPSGSTCSVSGSSRSEIWYAVLDYGTNYCNMHNLITGSGLDKVSGYTEKTNDDVCTQYSSADCEKY
ncbi:hypothetical protein CHS0354_015714 [Potamilus streckersoni]|uniref:Uncharacterized protein n=1 Tax=Potamilus streckersoni TaxID=2493646 RepID=A0AAE0TJ21_9BIVA|nr:hypothetical protein CHS0354_015714 [Potamilus streckersoni]